MRREVERYLDVLEKTFVIKTIQPFSVNRQGEIKKMPKIYFLDSGMRNIMIEDIRTLDLRIDRGALVENA